MSNTFKFGAGNWAYKDGKVLAYNDENNNFKPLPFDFTRASSATRVNSAGLIEEVGQGVPRIDYTNDANGALLLEPSRTNYLLSTEDFLNGSAWQAIGSVREAKNDGNSLGISEYVTVSGIDAYNDRLDGYTSKAPADGETYTYSAYYRATGDNIGKQINIAVNTTTGLGGSAEETITLTGDWVRHDLTVTYNSSVTGNIRVHAAIVRTVTSQTATSVDIVAPQVEQGSYATSYIPTSGSSVTRAADDNLDCFSLPTGIAGLTEGTMYVDIQVFDANAIGNRNWISLDNGTGGSDDRILIYMLGGASEIRGQIKSNLGANLAQMASSPVEDNSINKIAIAYKNNYCRFYVNGTSFNPTDSYTLSISNLQNIRIPYTGTNQMKLRDFRLYNTALTDSELIALTS